MLSGAETAERLCDERVNPGESCFGCAGDDAGGRVDRQTRASSTTRTVRSNRSLAPRTLPPCSSVFWM